jgi:hypothetical protein
MDKPNITSNITSNITLVAGPVGVGKTAWIREQLLKLEAPVGYFAPSTERLPLDAAYLQAEFPELVIGSETEWAQFQSLLAQDYPIFIEVGFYLDLAALSLPLDLTQARRVAILPPASPANDWQDWATEIFVGEKTTTATVGLHLWRSGLSGQVLDPASLDTFWTEVTQAAYGAVARAKGIFHLTDGRAFHFDFVAEAAETDYTELSWPRCREGRPQRCSGIEIIGTDLDQASIAQTLQDCCLDDQALAFYQAQLKQSVAP